jgi:4-hydroxy-tetrahydrodipicolinate reductase
MTRLALLGYGKMGRLVEERARAHGFEVALRWRSAELGAARFDPAPWRGIDVAIDFSAGPSVVTTVEQLAPLGVPLVVGTTGWSGDFERVRAAILGAQGGLVYGANFSLGVQVFYRTVAAAARLLAATDYEAWAYEIHHQAKKDAPSGTLKEVVRVMSEAGFSRPVDVASNRAGAIPGTHLVGFDSDADTIRIEHIARSRVGFADGALRAARWVLGRQGFFAWQDVWEEIAAAPRHPSSDPSLEG